MDSQTKPCTTCKQEKSLDEFYKDKRRKDGLYGRCKPCHLAATKDWWDRHPDKYSEYASKWRAENPEKAKEVSRKSNNKRYAENAEFREAVKLKAKQRYFENIDAARAYHRARSASRKEENAAYSAAYYKENSVSIKARAAKYAQDNKVKFRPYNAERAMRRVARKMQATPAWRMTDLMVAMYEEARRLTEETSIIHQVDHIIPLQHKRVCGLHVEHNLRVVPRSVNQSKGNRYWPDCPDDIRDRFAEEMQ